MTQSLIGVSKQELDTPILCIDLDVMESNIQKMASFMQERGKQWRPHQKCHKTPAIALKQMEAGAIGVTCAKISDAEVFAASGIKDILVANMIVGQRKVERVASLCRWADPMICCDHYAQVEPLAAACRAAGVTCRMMIEVNIGLDRVGINPGRDTLELAQAIDKLDGVYLGGIMGYEGHLLKMDNMEVKHTAINEAMGVLVDSHQRILDSGIECPVVSAGGTGSYQITSDCPGITELQAGGGIFADPLYQTDCDLTGLDYSLSVWATVVSRPAKERAILDSGRKSHFPDFHMPIVKGIEGAEVTAVSAEHCTLNLSGAAQDLQIGDKIELIPGYADFTTILHENFYGFRGDRLETVWPIQGRGKLQ
ncbi:MAG: alanine racemase [Planctomycetaceae bacterium]|nr:alanine racemase [Planctomycetaceae bacterium]